MLSCLRGKRFFVGIGTFLFGVVLGTIGQALTLREIFLCVGVGILAGMLGCVCEKYSNARVLFLATGIASFCFCVGSLRAEHEPHVLPPEFTSLLSQPVSLEGVIVADPDIRAKNQQLVVLVRKGGAQTRLLVFAPLFQHFEYGEEVLLAGTLTAPAPFTTDTGRLFRYDTYLAQKQIFATVPQASLLEVQQPHGFLTHVVDTLFDIKHIFIAGLGRALPNALAKLATGILTGNQHQIPEATLAALELSGMLWIVVLSGYHVTLIASSIKAVTSFLPRRFQYFCIVGGVAAIIFATGASAPSLRGALMAGLSLYARATHRTYDALRALSVVVAGMLLWNPFLLVYDFGFQLSILVTPAILLGVPILESRLLWIHSKHIREVVAVSTVAQLACLPLVLWQTGSLELWAIPANILTMWLVPLAMVSSFAAGIAGIFLPPIASLTQVSPLASLAGLPAYYTLSYLSFIAKSAASLPYAALSVPDFSFAYVVLMYLFLIVLFARLRRKEIYTTSLKKRFSITSQFTFSKNAST